MWYGWFLPSRLSAREDSAHAAQVIHQDVFSRYCGGVSAQALLSEGIQVAHEQSGAPGWTVEAAGFDLSDDGDKLARTGSAFLDGVRGGRLEGERGLWPTGMSGLSVAFVPRELRTDEQDTRSLPVRL